MSKPVGTPVISKPAVEEAIETLKSGFEADGASVEVGQIDQDTITIHLHLNDKTCRECLLPAPELELLIRQALLDKGINTGAVRVEFIEDY